ncbi:MAG: hypothetical protein K5849_07225 [Bacteroidales bacterium]|nr:hypothetical protein [Bacteroidales bacterium]
MKKLFVLLCCLSALAMSARAQQTITAGGVSFLLADEFEVSGREQLSDGEALMISPKVNPDNDRLVLKIHPDVLKGINGLTSEEVSDMLKDAVDQLAGVIANNKNSGYTLDNAYRIRFEDSANCPVAYSDLSGKDRDGVRFLLHAEAALTDGYIISGCAIASTKSKLDDLVDIYREAMAGERDVPQGLASMRPVSVGRIAFKMDGDFTIISREPLDPGENLRIVPDDRESNVEELFLLLMPDILPNADRISTERVSELLKNSTTRLADAVANTYGLSKNYRATFDNDGLYPIAYTNLKGKDDSGATFLCHAETALVNGTVVSCCAVAAGEEMLSRMIGTYNEAIAAALR